MDRDLLQRGTTKHLQTHKHNNPRHTARALIVPIGVFAIKIGRFRCKPIAQMPSNMSTAYSDRYTKLQIILRFQNNRRQKRSTTWLFVRHTPKKGAR